MWFEELVGFQETDAEQVRSCLNVEDEVLTSSVNNRSMNCGTLTTPSLREIVNELAMNRNLGEIKVREIVANVQKLHTEPSSAGAVFQAASQFNLLEMVRPSITPEEGIDGYEHDHTQGPACAIACGAGTIYRNYFVPLAGQLGQTASQQIDCLQDFGELLGNNQNQLWEMQNGYALATEVGLTTIGQRLNAASDAELDHFRESLRIGLQSNTEVTLHNAGHSVTQAYCSALPIAYSSHHVDMWEPFARLVLEAAYEATLGASVLNSVRTGNNKAFLTLLGGGAFGNPTKWIIDAIDRALRRFAKYPLEVGIVSHGLSNPHVQQLVAKFSAL